MLNRIKKLSPYEKGQLNRFIRNLLNKIGEQNESSHRKNRKISTNG